jgi:hypothetical protein
MEKRLFLVILFIHWLLAAMSQVGINNDGSAATPRAMLDIKSSSKGVLLPRMTTEQRNAIPVQPADAGLMVFDTDTQSLFLYNGQNWLTVTAGETTAPFNRVPVPAISGGHHFGKAVAIQGDYCLIGSGYTAQDDQGSAYMFQKTASGWIQQVKLTASDAATDRHFGGSVAVYGNYAVVGTEPIGNTTGGAYVFVRNGNTWTEQVKLTAPDGVQGDYFGKAVAITNDMIFVGAPGKDTPFYTNIGAVYIYKRVGSNWNYAGVLFANSPVNNDNFGEVMAAQDNYLVVGIPQKTLTGYVTGGGAQVFFYNGTNWGYQKTLVPISANTNSRFGSSVAISNDNIAIGQPGLTVSGKENAGRVAIYFRSGVDWMAGQSIYEIIDANNYGVEGDRFGMSVALSHNTLLIGIPDKTDGSYAYNGITHVYTNDFGFFSFKRTLRDINGQSELRFGRLVAIDASSNRYVIGAPGKNNYSGQVSFGIAD